MTLPELSIRRPVLATVMSLAIVLIGLVCYDRLSIREYPRIDEPIVTVDTTYRGASAEIIESRVTSPLEDSISGIEGVDLIQSFSRAERSCVCKLIARTNDKFIECVFRIKRIFNRLDVNKIG